MEVPSGVQGPSPDGDLGAKWGPHKPEETFENITEEIDENIHKLECRPMPNVMAALPNLGGALCSRPQFG